MAFQRVNPSEKTKKRIEKDENFKYCIESAQSEYELIQMLVKIREENGLTQSDISARTGLTQQMISRIEKIGNMPRLDNFLKYVSALGVKIKIEY